MAALRIARPPRVTTSTHAVRARGVVWDSGLALLQRRSFPRGCHGCQCRSGPIDFPGGDRGGTGRAAGIPGRRLRRRRGTAGSGRAPAGGASGAGQHPLPSDPRAGCNRGWAILRRARLGHRPVQASRSDRRRGNGHGLHGRAGATRPAQGRAEDHQARNGLRPGDRPVRGRATGAGPDGPPPHRQGPRGRDDGVRPAVLRHGTGQGHSDHPVL